MKHVIRKAYWDYEKEELWINQMAKLGLILCDYSWCRYVFEENPNNDYQYRIQLLDNPPSHPESIAYLKFLEETKVEHVASYMNWIYLRKSAQDGSFEIYSDLDSKIKYYRKVRNFWLILCLFEFGAGIFNLVIGVMLYNHNYGLNFYLGLIVVMIGLLMLFYLIIPIQRKIKGFKTEQLIIE